MADEMIRFFGRATGRVQGVGFRFFVQQNALEIGLTGWVRNMEDGSVEMEVHGAPANILSHLEALQGYDVMALEIIQNADDLKS